MFRSSSQGAKNVLWKHHRPIFLRKHYIGALKFQSVERWHGNYGQCVGFAFTRNTLGVSHKEPVSTPLIRRPRWSVVTRDRIRNWHDPVFLSPIAASYNLFIVMVFGVLIHFKKGTNQRNLAVYHSDVCLRTFFCRVWYMSNAVRWSCRDCPFLLRRCIHDPFVHNWFHNN